MIRIITTDCLSISPKVYLVASTNEVIREESWYGIPYVLHQGVGA